MHMLSSSVKDSWLRQREETLSRLIMRLVEKDLNNTLDSLGEKLLSQWSKELAQLRSK